MSVLDAGVHSKAASWREAMRSIACQEDIACLQQLCTPQKAMYNGLQALRNIPSASQSMEHTMLKSRIFSLVLLAI